MLIFKKLSILDLYEDEEDRRLAVGGVVIITMTLEAAMYAAWVLVPYVNVDDFTEVLEVHREGSPLIPIPTEISLIPCLSIPLLPLLLLLLLLLSDVSLTPLVTGATKALTLRATKRHKLINLSCSSAC